MVDIFALLIFIIVAFVFVVHILPEFPRWARVSFWLAITVGNIIYDDALFAAISATYATIEWYSDGRRS